MVNILIHEEKKKLHSSNNFIVFNKEQRNLTLMFTVNVEDINNHHMNSSSRLLL